MNAATLRKSLRLAIEELEEPLDDMLLQKSEDADDDDEDEFDDDDDEMTKAIDEYDEDDEDEEDDDDEDEKTLRKARRILKARNGKKSKKSKKMSDDDYTDDEIDDEDDDDEDDMDDMDKAILMEDEEVSRDKAVMRYGRGMKTIIFMRKSLKDQGKLIKSLRREVRQQAKVSQGSLELLHKIGQLVVTGATMTKSISENIDEIGSQPERTRTVRKSRKNGSSNDFKNPTNAGEANNVARKVDQGRSGSQAQSGVDSDDGKSRSCSGGTARCRFIRRDRIWQPFRSVARTEGLSEGSQLMNPILQPANSVVKPFNPFRPLEGLKSADEINNVFQSVENRRNKRRNFRKKRK